MTANFGDIEWQSAGAAGSPMEPSGDNTGLVARRETSRGNQRKDRRGRRWSRPVIDGALKFTEMYEDETAGVVLEH